MISMYQCVAADINCLTDSKLRHVRSYIHGQQQQRNNSHVTPSADSTRDHTDTDSTPSSSRSSTPSLDSVIADDCHSHHQSPPSARKRAAYKRKTKVCIDDLVRAVCVNYYCSHVCVGGFCTITCSWYILPMLMTVCALSSSVNDRVLCHTVLMTCALSR